jgi:hypothetical protein
MSGLDRMKKRMLWRGRGGDTQDDRNVSGKWRSFNASLGNSYQAENITFNEQQCRCLINPDKLKEDYDQKIISIDFKYGMKNGDTFYWDRTNTYWLAYLQDYSEEAYFRASIRRCDYEIEINGKKYRIYVRGPVETAIIWRQKHQLEFNELNYSMLFYIQKNEETLDFFERFKIVKFDGHNWRVSTTDKYSQDGIIEVYLEEYFDNKTEDLAITPEIIEPDTTKPYIDGPQIVRPYDEKISYSIVGLTSGAFVVNSTKVKINKIDEKSCTLDILTGKAGEFKLIFKPDDITKEEVSLDVLIKSF